MANSDASLRHRWMTHLQAHGRDVTLDQLTLPGTHDTATWTIAPGSYSRCQAWDLDQQLSQGIRFIDIRLAPLEKNGANDLMTYHGIDCCNVWFSDIIATCSRFLNTNKEETIVMSISNEHNVSPADFVTALDPFLTDSYVQDRSKKLFYIANAVPKLSDVAGQIVLFRRYECPVPYPIEPDLGKPGIDAVTGWPHDNETQSPTTGTPRMMIQDIWSYLVGTLDGKISHINGLMDTAEFGLTNLYYTGVWFINFTSTTTGGQSPSAIAATINPAVHRHITELLGNNSSVRLGTIVMDFPTESMVDLLIAANIADEPDVIQAHRPYMISLYQQTRTGQFISIGEAYYSNQWNYVQALPATGIGHMLIKVDGNPDPGRIYPGDTVKIMSTQFTNDDYVYIEGVGANTGGNRLFYTKSTGYYDPPSDVEWKVEIWSETPNVEPGPLMRYYMIRFRNCSTKVWPLANGLLTKSVSGDTDYSLSCHESPETSLSVWKIRE